MQAQLHPTPHVMVDLETLASDSDAAVISIGAVAFNPETGTIGATFKVNVKPESAQKFGGSISASTVMWWMGQSDQARSALLDGQVPLDDALRAFATFLRENAGDRPIIWGNGATFDNVVLRSAFKSAGVYAPWSFRNDYCYRTLKNLFPEVPFERIGTHHDSLADAMTQAVHLNAIFRKMRGLPTPRPPGPMEPWADNKV